MRVHNITYLVKEGVKNIFFNKLMSFACIGVLIACLLLIGSAALASLTVSNIVGVVESQNEIVLILEDSMGASDISAMDLTLENMDNVSQVRFISKEEKLESEKANMEEYAILFDSLDQDNPLFNSYVVQLEDLEFMEDTVARLSGLDGVERVKTATEVVSVLLGIRKAVTYAGLAVVLILVVVSIVIITNTIKLTVFSRRREINIMKYVGATDSFIRLPFVVEGMFIGLIAAGISFLMLGFGYTYLLDWSAENYGEYLSIVTGSLVTFQSIALEMFLAFAVLGVFIGVVSSGLFVRKYLRV